MRTAQRCFPCVSVFFRPQSLYALPQPRGGCLGLASPHSQRSLPRLGLCVEKNALTTSLQFKRTSAYDRQQLVSLDYRLVADLCLLSFLH